MATTLKENAITLLSRTLLVDLDAANGTEKGLYTVPAGKTCIVTHIVMHTFTDIASDAPAVITFGATGGDCDQFLGHDTNPQTLTEFAIGGAGTATMYGIVYLSQGTPDTPSIAETMFLAGTEFGVEITTKNGVAVTCTMDVFGYLF